MSKRRKKKKNHIHIYIVLLLAVVLLGIAVATENKASTEQVDLDAYFASEPGLMAVIRDYELTHEDMLLHDGRLYASVKYVTEKLNRRFYFDEKEELLLYTLPEGVKTANRNGIFDNAPILYQDGGASYVLMDYVASYTNMYWEYYDKPQRVVIHTDMSEREEIHAAEGAPLRQGAGEEHPIMTNLGVGDGAVKLDESSEWLYVCTEDGLHGYIAKTDVISNGKKRRDPAYTDPVFPMVTKEQNVCLAWHLVSVPEDNDYLEPFLENAGSVNVVSPTWLHLTDGKGTLESFASAEYVIKAHSLGKKVWVLVNNMDGEVYGDTLTGLLSAGTTRAALIGNIMAEVKKVGADGINVDFESVPAAAGPAYVQFIRELSLRAHAEGLVLSVDNYVPSAWTTHYDRREQAAFADYVVIMGYDEHYIGSDAGSTASLPFVCKGIEETLNEVPAEKLINAVPFYTRLWKGAGEKLTSSTLAIRAIPQLLEEYSLEPIWDETLGQNYVEFTMDGGMARIWLEDAESMKMRLTAMSDYHLAGLAGWRLGMEDAETWKLIADYFAQQ